MHIFYHPPKNMKCLQVRDFIILQIVYCGKISEFYSSEISKPSFFSGYYLGQHVMKLLHCGDSKTWQVDLLITPKSLIGGL